MNDRQIVALYLARDEQAIERTAAQYGRRLRSLAERITADIQTAEECENDTYLEAWQRIPPHEPFDYLGAFLSRIVRHLALNRCRDRARQKRSGPVCVLSDELEQCLPAPDNCACRVDELVLGEVINRFLASLDTEKRRLFLRRYWYFDSVADLCRRFEMSESKVKTTLHRCRKALRDMLEKEGFVL